MVTECAEIAGAMEDFEAARCEAAKKTVWYLGGCNSWYLDKQGIPGSWPWNYSRFVEQMREPLWAAFYLVKTPQCDAV